MRRPSPIPISAPPAPDVEPTRTTASIGGSRDDGTDLNGLSATDPREDRTARTSPESGDGPRADAPGEGPLTPRDRWRAAKARRRALRSEIRRFTQRSRRRRIGWIVAIAVALLVVGGSTGAAYSPLFAVEKITVEGASPVTQNNVRTALAGQIGRPLALVDSSAVKAALVNFPLIETYRLEAHPPHELVVRIVERTPVGVVASQRGYTVVDAAGVPLSTTAERPAGYALIDLKGGTDASSFRSVGVVLRALPADLRAQVDTVTAATADAIEMQLTSGPRIVWGSADQSALKVVALQKLMAAKPGQGMYDISSPDVGIVG